MQGLLHDFGVVILHGSNLTTLTRFPTQLFGTSTLAEVPHGLAIFSTTSYPNMRISIGFSRTISFILQ